MCDVSAAGDEILNGYIDFGKRSSSGAMMAWGFTTERCSEEVRRVSWKYASFDEIASSEAISTI